MQATLPCEPVFWVQSRVCMGNRGHGEAWRGQGPVGPEVAELSLSERPAAPEAWERQPAPQGQESRRACRGLGLSPGSQLRPPPELPFPGECPCALASGLAPCGVDVWRGASLTQGPQAPPLSLAPRAVLCLPLLCCVSASARRGLSISHTGGHARPKSQALGSQGAGVPQFTSPPGHAWGQFLCSAGPDG